MRDSRRDRPHGRSCQPGSLLDEPVFLDDWDEDAALVLAMSELAQIEVEQLEERRYLARL